MMAKLNERRSNEQHLLIQKVMMMTTRKVCRFGAVCACMSVCRFVACSRCKPLSKWIIMYIIFFAADKGGKKKLSKKQQKLLNRMKIAELKKHCERPDVVEVWDVTSMDPQLLVFLKVSMLLASWKQLSHTSCLTYAASDRLKSKSTTLQQHVL